MISALVICRNTNEHNRIEAWLSLVERRVRDAEAASSNLVASMVWVLRNVEKSMFLRTFLLAKRDYR